MYDTRHFMIAVMIVILISLTDGQYPNCVSCNDGSIALSPLSYNTMRSNVFNGTQPSNEGCTNGVSIDGQVTIDCVQETNLIDCNRGFNGGDYSDLSNTFAWNRTTSVAQQVPVVFRFDQQINISRISMFFWNSQSNSIIVPNVMMYWSNDDSITPSNEITITPPSPDRTGDGRRRLNIDINNNGLQFQYLRIEMSFYNSEWIFLGEVLFCGNVAPYHITQPSTDYDEQIVSPTATMTNLMCSLNITIPSSMIITWLHNGSDAMVTSPNEVTQTGNTATLLIGSLQPLDAGIYQCSFDDGEWALRRNIRLIIADPQIIHPPVDHIVTFDKSTSSVQLMCSLNIDIPSSVMVTWTHNGISVITTPPNEVTQTGNTTTLLIGDPQPSDAGVYVCSFIGLNLQRIINLGYTSISTTITTTTTIAAITTTTTATTNTATTATAASDTTTHLTTTNIDITTTPTAITSSPSSIITMAMAPSNDTTSSSDSSTNVGVIVAPIIVVIVAAVIVVIFIIIFYKWKKRKVYAIYDKPTNLHEEETPYYSTVHSRPTIEKVDVDGAQPNGDNNQQPCYAVPDKKENARSKSVELQESNVDFTHDPDYDHDVELDIYAAPDLPERTEASTIFDGKDEDNPIYSEAINPTVIIDSKSHNYSLDNDSLCPYASIYADPLPLTKSEGPPIVSNKNIEQLHQLGTGQFGEVILANTIGLSNQYLGIGKSNDSTISIKVAVKMLKSSPSEEVRKAFEKEIKFMSRLKDDNVIKLLGICTTGTPFIMMQYMENGDLNNYLKKFEFTYETEKVPAANEITPNALVYMSYQIASGMKYLSSCKFIHRDLAARNILVGVDFTVKIADFGMSQNLYSAYYYKVGGRIFLPIRWMAYECFFGKFSVKTDVWAFGITLWEIFTLCKCQPFPELSDQLMIEDAIKGANREIPNQPDICPNNIYEIMKSCFHHEPSKRAGFGVLCDQLNECYSSIL